MVEVGAAAHIAAMAFEGAATWRATLGEIE
jgi:hypothetical protein